MKRTYKKRRLSINEKRRLIKYRIVKRETGDTDLARMARFWSYKKIEDKLCINFTRKI